MNSYEPEPYIRMLSGFRALVKVDGAEWDNLPSEITSRCERPSRRVDVGVEMSFCPEVGFFYVGELSPEENNVFVRRVSGSIARAFQADNVAVVYTLGAG